MPFDPVRGLSFPLRFGPLGHFERSSGVRKLEDNMKQIVLTSVGERIMRPRFGTLGLKAVFRKLDDVTCSFLESEMRVALTKYEARAQILGVRCSAIFNRQGESSMRVTIQYRVRDSGEFRELSVEV